MARFNPEQDDLYKVLGVDASADAGEIKKTYRKLAQEYHPDANKGDEKAEEQFKKINAAYDVLKDADKRKEYDEMRELLRSGAHMGGGSPFGGAPGGGSTRTINFEDLSDLFGSGRFGGGPEPGGPRGRGARRGNDVESNLNLTFENAMAGVTTQVNVPTDVACDACDGSGARAGTFPEPCPGCGGRGTVSDTQGFFALSRPCPQCGGEGQIISDPCPQCGGHGVTRRTRRVKVAIPPGVKDKARVRVKGRGESGANGGPPGDLYVVVHVAPHKTFGRKGDDLTVSVPVPFETLALGGQVKAPTLDGAVTIKLPPGTRSGRVFKVAGRGAPITTAKSRGRRKKKDKRKSGDLLVTVDVVVPTELTPEAEDALRHYSDVAGGRAVAGSAAEPEAEATSSESS